MTSDSTPSSRRLRLGGVYYVELPPVVAEDKDQASWIEFGRPPKDIFYHQTIPFGPVNTLPLANPLPERRICIAFDVIPVWD